MTDKRERLGNLRYKFLFEEQITRGIKKSQAVI